MFWNVALAHCCMYCRYLLNWMTALCVTVIPWRRQNEVMLKSGWYLLSKLSFFRRNKFLRQESPMSVQKKSLFWLQSRYIQTLSEGKAGLGLHVSFVWKIAYNYIIFHSWYNNNNELNNKIVFMCFSESQSWIMLIKAVFCYICLQVVGYHACSIDIQHGGNCKIKYSSSE